MKRSFLFTLLTLTNTALLADFQLVGSNPVVSQTAFPAINVMYEWDERIYMGYGDVNAHPGPIVITSYDPESKNFVAEFSAGTDVVWVFREIGDRLYIPSGDGVHYADFADYTVLSDRSLGYTRGSLGTIHLFDITSPDADGANLWFTSTGVHGISRSLGSERNWLNVFPTGSWWDFVFPLDGRVYNSEFSFTPDGTRAPHALPSSLYKPTSFINAAGSTSIVSRSGSLWVETAGDLNIINGGRGRDYFRIRDFAIDDNTLYVMKENGSICRSLDLRSWQDLRLTAPSNARSIAVHDGVLYSGTADGKLFAAQVDGAPDPGYSQVGFKDELSDRFGSAVALDDNHLLVGAPHQGDRMVQSGRAYLYRRSDPTSPWELQQTFTPSRPNQQSSFFGSAVALNGSYLAIVESGYSSNGRERGDRARVHVYQRQPDSTWTEHSASPFTHAWAQSVAISNLGWLAIATDRAVHRYNLRLRDPEPSMSSPPRADDSYLPTSRICFVGQTWVVGLRGDPSRAGGPGKVTVASSSSQRALISSDQPDWFGDSIASHRSLVTVGAPADDSALENAGAVHIFDRLNNVRLATIRSPEPLPFALFGTAVAMNDDVLIVGAEDDEHEGAQTGAAYLFRRVADNQWEFDYKIAPPPSVTSGFGASAVIEGHTAVIGGLISGRGTGTVEELETRLRIIDTSPCALRSWGASFNLTDLETLSDVSLDGDRLSPLVEYSFLLDPTVADERRLHHPRASSGLPMIRHVPDGIITIEFVRPKDNCLELTLQSSSDGKQWNDESGWLEFQTDLNPNAERVTMVKEVDLKGSSLFRFAINYRPPED